MNHAVVSWFSWPSDVSWSQIDRRLAALLVASPHNLVSSRADEAHVLAAHVAEARLLGESLGRIDGRWMDLGTGGGLPGLVLARLHPQVEWVLMDAKRKKADEVRRFATELKIRCRVVAGRAEDLARMPQWREGFDGVVSRAVAPLRVMVELARGFLVEGGDLVAVKGSAAGEEVQAASGALHRCAMEVHSVSVLSGDTRVVRLRAVGSAPEEIPRQAGVPQRRPL